MALINRILKQFEKQELPPELMGIRFDNNEGGIDDGAQYNTYGKPMPDWLKAEQDEGWIPYKHFGDKP